MHLIDDIYLILSFRWTICDFLTNSRILSTPLFDAASISITFIDVPSQSSDTSRIARTGFRLLDAHSLRPSQKSSPHSSFRFLLSHRKDKHVRSALPLSDSSMSVRYDPAPFTSSKSTRGETFCTMLYMTYFFSPYLPAGVSFFYIPENNLQFPFVFPVTSAIYHRN